VQLNGKRVVVTGGHGFVGQRVVARLRERGAEVFVPRSAEYDLRTDMGITRMMADARPQAIVHLAAVVGGIGANQANPGRYFYDNAMMGIQLIEQARLAQVEKFVAIGTICAYPKSPPVPFREDDLWNGYPEETNAPYGLAKKMMLVQCQAYRQQYGFSGIYLLPVNLYGPGDNFDLDSSHVIPAMIRKFETARTAGASAVTLWGTGSASREFLYVDDCADAILLATERYDGAMPVNLGSGMEISVRDLASRIASHVGFDGAIAWDTSRPDGQPRRCLNTERAAAEFGFRAQVDFDEGLRRTIAWWRTQQSAIPTMAGRLARMR